MLRFNAQLFNALKQENVRVHIELLSPAADRGWRNATLGILCGLGNLQIMHHIVQTAANRRCRVPLERHGESKAACSPSFCTSCTANASLGSCSLHQARRDRSATPTVCTTRAQSVSADNDISGTARAAQAQVCQAKVLRSTLEYCRGSAKIPALFGVGFRDVAVN